MNQPAEAPVVSRAYALSLWTVQRVQRFPRALRQDLGSRLVAHALDLVTALVEAAYSRSERKRLLDFSSRRANSLRFLLRMAKDLHLITVDQLGFAAAELEEIGRMIGGWQRATASGEPPRPPEAPR